MMDDRLSLSCPEGPTRWDWWPLARLLTVLGTFASLAWLYFGWTLDPFQVLSLPRRVFEVFSFFTLLSSGLAHLYLVLLMFPLYALVTLNDVFYDATLWIASRAFPVRSRRVLMAIGLSGEILLFVVAIAAIYRISYRL